jgi:SAM-dependent methyltransferase
LWNELAEIDPLWAILSWDDKRRGTWDLEEFLGTGDAEINFALDLAAGLGLPTRNDAALDFGCGVGRLTRPLAGRFVHCEGVDISPRMVELAAKYNDDVSNVRFVVNTEPHLELYEDKSFDFIYTNRVLQHLPSDHAIRSILSEFCRLLAPGGVLCFGVPMPPGWKYQVSPSRHLFRILTRIGVSNERIYRRLGFWPAPMRGASETTVRGWLKDLNSEVLEVSPREERIILYFVGSRGREII